MEVICLEDEACYALIDKVVAKVKEKQGIKQDKSGLSPKLPFKS